MALTMYQEMAMILKYQIHFRDPEERSGV